MTVTEWIVRRRALRVERHPLGPRLHVLGRRVHECHLGLGLGALAAIAFALGLGAPAVSLLALALAAWLVAKDWRDLNPSTRDTAAWSWRLHRRPDAARPAPAVDRVPLLAALATFAVGAVNVASAMTAELPGRLAALLTLAPASQLRLAHALALPAGLALMGLAWPLARRRRRALSLALALLGALALLNLLKGLDFEEAALGAGLAAALWRSRAAFWVTHPAPAVRRVLAVLGGAAAAAVVAAAVAASSARGGLPLAGVPEAALSLLTLGGGPSFRAPFSWLPAALGVLGAGAGAAAAAALLAPLRLAHHGVSRSTAAAFLRRHGGDTLSAFKLRRDLVRRLSPDGAALTGYRVEAGVLLVAGDPVGTRGAAAGALEDTLALARRQGLAVGVVGASEQLAGDGARLGLRRLYLGDEAILPAGAMDLSGGRHKSLRKAVNRVARHGFAATAHRVETLDRATLAELEAISERWRRGAPERGFSMAHDAIDDELLPDATVVVARDDEGRIGGFLHFVPVFGRRAVSLAFMRRDRDTPNGMSDFLVVEAARLLGEEGIEELSLNFASFGRWLREPAGPLERLLGRALRVADRWFQVERLLRFNAKFEPAWRPRYLLFGRPAELPRVALAAMWAEGQLPRPRVPGRRRAAALAGPVAA